MHIGLVGATGAGKSSTSKIIHELCPETYLDISLSSFIRSECKRLGLPIDKQTLSHVSYAIKTEKGHNHFAKLTIDEIRKNSSQGYIIDGIRNTYEIEELKKQFRNRISIIGIYNSDLEVAVTRVLKRQKDSDLKTFAEINKLIQDELDGDGFGVNKSLQLCDYVINNNKDIQNLQSNIASILKLS